MVQKDVDVLILTALWVADEYRGGWGAMTPEAEVLRLRTREVCKNFKIIKSILENGDSPAVLTLIKELAPNG